MSRPLPRRRVGLIAAAGRATRLAPLPCSKELVPVGFMLDSRDGRPRPKPVSLYLIEQMRGAGATQLCVVLRSGKWDIADYYGDGSRHALNIAYFVMGDPFGPPFSAGQALPFLADAVVLFGFPDLLLYPTDVVARVVARLEETDSDIVLALCPMQRAGAMVDVVNRDSSGRVTRLEPKESNPMRQENDWAWTVAAWRPSFSVFMQEELARLAKVARSMPQTPTPEWPFGSVISAALRNGLHVDSVGDESWRMLDVGTPAGLTAAASFPGVWQGEASLVLPDGE